MKNKYIWVLVCLSLIGCCHIDSRERNFNVKSQQTNSIQGRYYNLYIDSTNVNNLVIGGILHEVANAYITNDFYTVNDAMVYQMRFFGNLKTNVISYNYPIMATEEDIMVTQGFLVEILSMYYTNNGNFVSVVKTVVPNMANNFIFMINDYEYEKRANE